MIPGSATPLFLPNQGDSAFKIERSLRFNSADSAYLNRTPSSAGNRKTWTWAGWVKRSKLGTNQFLFETRHGSTDATIFSLGFADGGYSTTQDALTVFRYSFYSFVTTPLFRDTSAWYHIVLSADTTQSTASNRLKLYVNGVQVTDFNSVTYPSLNEDLPINTANVHKIGSVSYLDGYLADVHFIDGQALAPTDFGEFDDNNVWHPINFDHSNKLANLGAWPGMTTGTPFNSTYSIANLFDGNTSTYMCPISGSSCVFTPTTPITVSSSIRIWGIQSSTNEYFKINDTEVTNVPNSFGWFTPDIGSTITSLDKFEFYTTSGSYAAIVGAIEIDGEILTIGDINSFHLDFSDNSSDAALGTDSSGNSNTWTVNNIIADEQNYVKDCTGVPFSAGYSFANMFDGSISSYMTPTSTTWAVFEPSTAISVSTIEIYGGWNGAASLAPKINGIAITNAPTAAAYAWFTPTLTGGVSITSLEKFEFYTAGGSNAFIVGAIKINGDILISGSGANIDSLIDTPTNYTADSGNNGGNYATLNPLVVRDSYISYRQGNLEMTASVYYRSAVSTITLNSGKFYIEALCSQTGGNTYDFVGAITNPGAFSYPGSSGNDDGFGYYSGDGGVYQNTVAQATYTTWTTGDIIGLAYDGATGKCWVSKNGTWQNSGDPAAGTGHVHTISSYATKDVYYCVATGINGVMTANFGQRPFAYTPPTGFKSLCTTNLTDPTIADGSTAMDVVTYTGTNASKTITGLNFSPDFIWTKSRSRIDSHGLHDIVRGRASNLYSDLTNGENTSSASADLVSFDSNGYTLGTVEQTAMNRSGETYVAWTWDAGTSTVTNTDGSITSSVRANASTGFSIVTWPASSGTVGHGLGVAPSFIISKSRTNIYNWWCYHTSIGNNPILLNTTNAKVTSTLWPSLPTSSVFGHNTGLGTNNMVAYCWAPVDGYSSFGSYTGNGSADGPFVFTGMKPAFILIKRTDAGSNWQIRDSARQPDNVDGAWLFANLSNAEESSSVNPYLDKLSNGFKLRGTSGDTNASGGTYIYAAFAESPFQYARAR